MKNVRFQSGINQIIAQTELHSLKSKHKKSESELSRPPSLKKFAINLQNLKANKKVKGLKSVRMLELQQKYNRITQLRQSFQKQYNSLLQFYQTNQQKLRKIIKNQLSSSNNYLYSKQINAFIKTGQIEPLRVLNYQILSNDLSKLIHFLSQFSTKKKIRQVEILKQSMLARQSLIRQSSSHEQYEHIYQNMRIPLKGSGFTIYDQWKAIQADFNLENKANNMHEILYNKMCDAQECVNLIMKKEAREKHQEREKAMGNYRGKDRQRNRCEDNFL